MVKNPLMHGGDKRDPGSIPGLGRFRGGGRDNPLHIVAWRIPWTQEPGVLQSTGSHRAGYS